MRKPVLLLSSLLSISLGLPSCALAKPNEALQAIDPNQAQFDTPPVAPAAPSADNANPFGGGIQGQPLGRAGAPKRTLDNPNPNGPSILKDDENPPLQGIPVQAGPGWAPANQNEVIYEPRISRLEQLAFGSTYPEHDIDDRVDHLETEVFSKRSEGQPIDQRVSKLEMKMLGQQSAFGAQQPSAYARPPMNQSLGPAQSQISPPQSSPAMPVPNSGAPGWSNPGTSWPPRPADGSFGMQGNSMPPMAPQRSLPLQQSQMGTQQLPPGQYGRPPLQQGMQQGFGSGMQQGMGAGMQQGFGSGMQQGMGAGMQQGYGSGMQQGMGAGIPQGFGAGMPQGFGSGMKQGMGSGMPPRMGSGQGMVVGMQPQGMGSGMPQGMGAGNNLAYGTPSGFPNPATSTMPSGSSGASLPPPPPAPPAVSNPAQSASASSSGASESPSSAGLTAADRPELAFDSVVKGMPYKAAAGDYFASINKFANGSVARWTRFPILVHFPQGSPPQWEKALEEALSAWKVYVPIKNADPMQFADIEVGWINHLPPRCLGQTNLEIFNGRMRVTVYLLRPSYYLQGIPEKALKRVAMHEFGHALGIFGHSSDQADLMYTMEGSSAKDFAGIKGGGITARDSNTLKKVYESRSLPHGFQSPHPLGWSLQINDK